MNISSEQLNAAMQAAEALTNPKDEKVMVPMRHAAGALILHQLSIAMQNGEFALAPAGQEEKPPGDKAPPVKTPGKDKK